MRIRGWTVITAFTTLTLAITSCGGTSADSERSAQMYTWITNESDRAQWQAFIDAAQEEDPEFDLTLEGPSFDDYWEAVRPRMGASDAPCILTSQAARAQELGDLLMPLDDLVDEAGLDMSQYNDAMVEGLTVDGDLRALPYDASPLVLYYNKDIYDDADVDTPDTAYTTDQYLSDMQAIADTGVDGITFPPDFDRSPGFAVAHSNGNIPVDDNGELQLTDPDFVDDIQWAYDLVAEHEVASPPTSGDARDIAVQTFIAGNAATVMEGPWHYTTFMEDTDANVGVAAIPTSSGTPRGMIQGTGFGIAQSCDDPEAAFENIMALTTPHVVGELGYAQGNIPSIDTAVDRWAEDKPDDIVEAVEAQLEDVVPFRGTPQWYEIDTEFKQYVSPGYEGSETAEDILTRIQDSVR